MRITTLAALLALALPGASHGEDLTADARMRELADRAVAQVLAADPTWAYYAGLPLDDHGTWPDRSPAARARFEAAEDALAEALSGIDAASLSSPVLRLDHALLEEWLTTSRGLRVCRSPLWDVNHMFGWHLGLARVAREQPLDDAHLRAQALARWNAVPALVEREIANLREGLAAGYSAPRSVVERVIAQVDGLARADADASPLAEPARRSDDADFAAAFRTAIEDVVNPALARFGDYLRDDYLPRARESLAVSANPDGAACYDASLRSYTTLERDAQAVHDLGAATVAGHLDTIATIGERLYGTRDVPTILARVRDAADNRFDSEEALIAFSREMVERAFDASTGLFNAMPSQPLRADPFLDYMRGSGTSAHYESSADPAQPAYYRIDSEGWRTETRGAAEITAVHESYPGHHMQFAQALTLEKTPLARLSFNSAYAEGWGRYAEQLAEEAGIYTDDYAPIQRRAWPARGMVADPGLHVLGWSREQTVAYLLESGRFGPQETDALVDRMAVLPGQLTAYDSGGLEILALRREAEAALGDAFDLRDFHDVVLGQGTVPLGLLRRNVEAWIAARQRAGADEDGSDRSDAD